MSESVKFDGRKFISANEASKLTGYTSDYVGQLSRLKKIESKMIGRTRFVNEEDILKYKLQNLSGSRSVSKIFDVILTKTEPPQAAPTMSSAASPVPLAADTALVSSSRDELILQPKKEISAVWENNISQPNEVFRSLSPLSKIGTFALSAGLVLGVFFAGQTGIPAKVAQTLSSAFENTKAAVFSAVMSAEPIVADTLSPRNIAAAFSHVVGNIPNYTFVGAAAVSDGTASAYHLASGAIVSAGQSSREVAAAIASDPPSFFSSVGSGMFSSFQSVAKDVNTNVNSTFARAPNAILVSAESLAKGVNTTVNRFFSGASDNIAFLFFSLSSQNSPRPPENTPAISLSSNSSSTTTIATATTVPSSPSSPNHSGLSSGTASNLQSQISNLSSQIFSLTHLPPAPSSPVASSYSKADVDLLLQQLNNALSSKIYLASATQTSNSQAIYQAVSNTNKIDSLTNVTLQTPTVSGGSFTGGTFSNPLINGASITSSSFSGSSISATGNISSGGTLTVTGTGTSSIAGFVGIGTTTPWAELSVNSDALGSAPAFAIGSSTQTNFVVTNGGNVGIGTTSPLASLDIFGNAIMSGLNRYLNFGAASGLSGYGFRDDGGSIQFKNSGGAWTGIGGGTGSSTWATTTSSVAGESINYSNGNSDIVAIGGSATTSAKFWFDPNAQISYFAGNAGFGTTTPSQTLSVQGNGLFSGTLTVANLIATSSTITLSGLGKNMLLTTDGSGNLLSSSTPTAANYLATSTTATSTFAGGLQAGGSTGLYVLQNGSVGVGTSAPISGLHIYGSTGSASQLTLDRSSSSFGAGLVFAEGGVTRWNTKTDLDGGGVEAYQIGRSSSDVKLTILSGGNVGLGTTSPYAQLSVERLSTTGTVIGADALTGFSGNLLDLKVASTSKFTIDSNGNMTVGGTLAPSGVGTNMLVASNASGVLVSSSTPTAANYLATSTTATSTFAGGLQAGGSTGLYVLQNGFIGIATSSPTYPLTIQGNSDSNANGPVMINGTSVGSQIGVGITLNSSAMAGGRKWSFFASGPTATPGAGKFAVFDSTAGAYRMTIDDVGRFGFGTTTTNTGNNFLTIEKSQNNTSVVPFYNYNTGASAEAYFQTIAGAGNAVDFGVKGTGTTDPYAYSWVESNIPYTIATNNTEKLRILAGGNVGIGTTSPSQTLSVQGNGFFSGNLFIGGAITATSSLTLTGANTGANMLLTTNASGTVVSSSTPQVAAINATSTIATSTFAGGVILAGLGGNVGIGSSTPMGTLGIETGASKGIVFGRNSLSTTYNTLSLNGTLNNSNYSGLTGGGTGDSNIYIQGGADIVFRNAGIENMRLVSSGAKFGIGTSTPTSKLSVTAGTANIDGGFNVSPSAGSNRTITIHDKYIDTIFSNSQTIDKAANLILQGTELAGFENGHVGIGAGTSTPYGILTITNTRATTVNTPLFLVASTTSGISTTTIFNILANGNVGIGTTSPSSLLNVYNGSANPLIVVDRGGGLFLSNYAGIGSSGLAYDANGNFVINSQAHADSGTTNNMTPRLSIISGTGNVGIGTGTPSQNLSVQGNGLFSGNLFIGGAITATSSLSLSEAARTSGSVAYLTVTGAADTGLAASTETADVQFNLARTKTHANGTITLQRDFLINAATHAFTNWAGGLITDLATLGITGAPLLDTNATSTNSHTLYLGASALNASTTNSYGLTVNANTGATNNYAAEFLGGNVGIGTTSPSQALSVQGNGLFSGTLTVANLIATSSTITLSGLGKNMLLTTDSSGNILASSTPTAAAYLATSTTATSMFAGHVQIGSNTNTVPALTSLWVTGGTTLRFGSNDTDANFGSYLKPDYTGALNKSILTMGVRNAGVDTDILSLQNGTAMVGTTTPDGVLNVAIGKVSGTALSVHAGNQTPVLANFYNDTYSMTNPVLQYFAYDTGTTLIGTPSAQSLQFFTNAYTNPRITILSGGNVGIGTTTPATALSVVGLTGAVGNFQVNSAAGINEVLKLTDNANYAADRGVKMGFYVPTGTSLNKLGAEISAATESTTGTYLTFNTENASAVAERMRISSAGNVGIGTTSPGRELTVSSATIPGIQLENTANGGQFLIYNWASNGSALSGRKLSFYDDNSDLDRMVIDNSGNVGIGTTSPTYPLDVLNNVNGSAPAAQFTSTTNSGIVINSNGTNGLSRNWFVGSNSIVYGDFNIKTSNARLGDPVAAGTSRFYIDGSGNIGIGTTNPSAKLDVAGFVNVDQYSGYNQGGQLLAYASSTNSNTIFGLGAGGQSATTSITAIRNTAIGFNALNANTTGTRSTAIGFKALLRNTTGDSNTAVGTEALALNTTGNNNVSLGWDALAANTIGSNNTGIGFGALFGNTTGSSSVALGYQAGLSITTGSNNIFIGQNVDATSSTATGELNIGNVLFGTGMYGGSSVSGTPVSGGMIGIGTTSPYSMLSVAGQVVAQNYMATSTTATSTLQGTVLAASGGNVGIRTSSPSKVLEVNGDAVIGFPNGTSDSVPLTLHGQNVYSGVNAFGNYGGLTLDASSGLTAAARKFMVTNALDGSKFAIVRSVDALTYPALGQLGVVTSGTADLVINNTGNVGIGTTTPSKTLTAYSTDEFPAFFSGGVVSGNYRYTAITMGQNLASGYASNIGYMTHQSDTSLSGTYITNFGETEGTTGIFIKKGGNVGIGTTSPAQKLDIYQSAASTNALISVNSTAVSTFFGLAGGGTAAGMGTITAHPDIFYTSNAERMRIDSAGLVGIGTTTPAQKLDIYSATNLDGVTVNAALGGAGGYRIYTTSVNANSRNWGMTTNYTSFGDFVIRQSNAIGGDPLNAGTSILTIGNTGNLGIGTTTPPAQLTVYGAGQTTSALTDTGNMGGTLFLRDSGFNVGNGGALLFGFTSTANPGIFAAIKGLATNGAGNGAGDLAFSTRNATTDAGLTERIMIKATGNVGIGTSTPNDKLTVYGGSGTFYTNFGNDQGKFYMASDSSFNYIESVNANENGVKNLRITGYGINSPALTQIDGTVISLNGNVGIGTTTPASLLDLSTASSNTTMRLDTTSVVSTARNWAMSANSIAYGDLDFRQSNVIGGNPVSAGTSRLYIDNTGDVGIGTTTPGQLLSVENTTGVNTVIGSFFSPALANGNYDVLKLGKSNLSNQSTALTYIYNSTAASQYMGFGFSGVADAFGYLGNGNIGIGTTSPDQKFTVMGNSDNNANGPVAVNCTTTNNIGCGLTLNGTGMSGGGNKWSFFTSGTTATPGAGAFAIYDSTAGQYAMTITPVTRNFGFGTTLSSGLATYKIRAQATSGTVTQALFATNDYNGSVGSGLAIESGASSGDTYEKIYAFNTGGSGFANLVLNPSGGNVGIGTTTPGTLFSIGDTTNYINFDNTATSTISHNLYVKGTLRAAVSYVGDLFFANNFSFSEAPLDGSPQALLLKNQFGSTTLAIDENGNLGLGTTSPMYKLQVMGDVAAESFVNISTRSAKTDISYLGDTDKASILEKIKNINIARYHYADEQTTDPLRLGLIAEEAPPEILSISGKGVDIYKFSTFILAGVQEQQKQLDGLTVRITNLETLLASSTESTGGVSLSSLSAAVSNAISAVKDWTVNSVTAAVGYFKSLAVGNSTTPTTITVFDKNGKAGCVTVDDVASGTLRLTAGPCASVGAASGDSAAPTASSSPSGTSSGSSTSTPPTLTLMGANPATVSLHSSFIDPGASALDSHGVSLMPDIISNNVNTSATGTYAVVWSAHDSQMNTATASRTVIVIDPYAPTGTTTPTTPATPEPAATSTPVSSGTATTTPIVPTIGTTTPADTTATTTP